jgi:hypothetical protein
VRLYNMDDYIRSIDKWGDGLVHLL